MPEHLKTGGNNNGSKRNVGRRAQRRAQRAPPQHPTDAIFNAARLNYSGEKLAFDDDELCTVLRAMYPDDYDGVLGNLQALKAEEEAKDGDAF